MHNYLLRLYYIIYLSVSNTNNDIILLCNYISHYIYFKLYYYGFFLSLVAYVLAFLKVNYPSPIPRDT